MIGAKDFDHEVVSAADGDDVDNLIEFDEFARHIHHFAPIGADADHRHGAFAHHQWVCDSDNFEITKVYKAVVTLANHARRNIQLLGKLRKSHPPICAKGVYNMTVDVVKFIAMPITDIAFHAPIL